MNKFDYVLKSCIKIHEGKQWDNLSREEMCVDFRAQGVNDIQNTVFNSYISGEKYPALVSVEYGRAYFVDKYGRWKIENL